MLSKINYNHMFIIVNSVIYFNGKLSIDIREGPGKPPSNPHIVSLRNSTILFSLAHFGLVLCSLVLFCFGDIWNGWKGDARISSKLCLNSNSLHHHLNSVGNIRFCSKGFSGLHQSPVGTFIRHQLLFEHAAFSFCIDSQFIFLGRAILFCVGRSVIYQLNIYGSHFLVYHYKLQITMNRGAFLMSQS